MKWGRDRVEERDGRKRREREEDGEKEAESARREREKLSYSGPPRAAHL
jgi:hypothetical protein